MKRLLLGVALFTAALGCQAQWPNFTNPHNVSPAAIDGTAIGATTPSSGAFTSLSASGAFLVNGTPPHGFGATTSNAYLRFTGTMPASGSGANYGMYIDPTGSPSANDASYGLYMGPTLNKAGSGTHADFATMRLDPPTIGAGAATLTNSTTLKITNAPSVGTNLRALWVAAGATLLDGANTFKGSTTNDSAAAGYIGELLTTTLAVGSQITLTTATGANVVTQSLTAGDWDCAGQVTHNAAATTSITLLQIGISASTATLPTQAGGSGIGTDPLAIYRVAASVPAGSLTTNVGPVRVSLSGTTNIFLVVNDTFTVAGMQAYGTIRCRRQR